MPLPLSPLARCARGAAVLLLAAPLACAAACVPDEAFAPFFQRYRGDPAFQAKRAARHIEVHDLAGQETVVRRALPWRRFARQYGVTMDAAWIAQQGLVMDETAMPLGGMQVAVFAPASDSFSHRYFFARSQGCWQLVRFVHDSL